MPQVVEVPGIGDVEFPDGMTDDQIASAIKANMPKRVKSFDNRGNGELVPSASVDPYADLENERSELSKWGQAGKNVAETGAQIATGIPAQLLASIGGLGATAYDITANGVMNPLSGSSPGEYADPTKVRDSIADYLTYRPDEPDSFVNQAANFPGKVITGAGDELAAPVDDIPYAGNVARAVPQALAAWLGFKGARPPTIKTPAGKLGNIGGVGKEAAPQAVRTEVPEPVTVRLSGKTPEERAKNYVASRTNVSWDAIGQEVRERLVNLAKTPDRLESLDATAVERAAVLQKLEVPITNATRGQLTRDPRQQRTEQLLKATEPGAELLERDISQNAKLLANIDALSKRQGGMTAGDLQTGKSVQGATRSLAASSKSNYDKLYKVARETEPDAAVSLQPVQDLLGKSPQIQNLDWVSTWIKKAGSLQDDPNAPMTSVRIADIQDLRSEATAIARTGGKEGHYASQVVKAIDESMESMPASAKAWKDAHGAFKAHRAEFADQAAISRLVNNKRGTKDRATALEDTWSKTVLNGSVEDWQALTKTLEKSGEGKQAIADLKSSTAQYIRDKATGGETGLKNSAGNLDAAWGRMKRAVDDIGRDKLEAIFGPEDTNRIYNIVESAQILKTEAPTGIKGSPTFEKALTFFDNMGKVPGLGKLAAVGKLGTKGAAKLRDIGKTERELKQATTSPLE